MARTPTEGRNHKLLLATTEETAKHPGCFGKDGPTVFVAITHYARSPLRRYLCAVHGKKFAERHNLPIPKSPTRKDDRAR